MSKASKIALARIDAAANIQVFLLQQKYLTSESPSTSSQNASVIQDVLRLAEYICSQSKLLQEANEDRQSSRFTLKHKSIIISKAPESTRSTALTSERGDTPIGTNTKEFLESSTVTQSVTDDLQVTADIPAEDSIKSNVRENSPERVSQIGANKSTITMCKASPGFDRLINKILSPVKKNPAESILSQSPNRGCTEINDVHSLDATSQLCSSPAAENITDLIDTIPATLPIESTSSVNCINSDRCDEENQSVEAVDISSSCTRKELTYDDISTVVGNDDDDYYDDDDDVFDLLRSVEDWSALKNFVRQVKPPPPVSDHTDHPSHDAHVLADENHHGDSLECSVTTAQHDSPVGEVHIESEIEIEIDSGHERADNPESQKIIGDFTIP